MSHQSTEDPGRVGGPPGTGHVQVEDSDQALDVYLNDERTTYHDAHRGGIWVEHRHDDGGVTLLSVSVADGTLDVSGEYWPDEADAFETDGDDLAFRLVAQSNESLWACFEPVDADRDLTVELRPRTREGVITRVERTEMQWTECGVQYRCRTTVNAAGGIHVTIDSRGPDDDEWTLEQSWMADEPARIVAVEREEIVDA
jgi:glucan biosynthesis protein